MISNDEKISSIFGRGYFGLSFFLENGSYVDIMTVFKEKNKDKRIRPNVGVIILSLLSVILQVSSKGMRCQHYKSDF